MLLRVDFGNGWNFKYRYLLYYGDMKELLWEAVMDLQVLSKDTSPGWRRTH
jgi:hypothetical protein